MGENEVFMFDDAGRPADLRGRAKGAIIEVHVDHDAGTLGFRINEGPYIEALKGFPKGAALRPWSQCGFKEDCVQFVGHLMVRA